MYVYDNIIYIYYDCKCMFLLAANLRCNKHPHPSKLTRLGRCSSQNRVDVNPHKSCGGIQRFTFIQTLPNHGCPSSIANYQNSMLSGHSFFPVFQGHFRGQSPKGSCERDPNISPRRVAPAFAGSGTACLHRLTFDVFGWGMLVYHVKLGAPVG